jgi:hypothetical protein
LNINFNLNHLSMRKILLTSMLLAAVLVSSAQGQASHSKKFYVKGGYTLKGKNLYGMLPIPKIPNSMMITGKVIKPKAETSIWARCFTSINCSLPISSKLESTLII